MSAMSVHRFINNRIISFFERYPLVFLSIILFLSHFLLFRSFGVYEDDSDYIVKVYKASSHIIRTDLLRCFTLWPQGRPIGFAFPHFIAWIGSILGGLDMIYILSFGLILLNTSLLYKLLHAISDNKLFAIIGTLTYILFPADTTKIFLTHMQIQLSFSFLLMAILFNIKGYKVLSYVVIFCTLLTYETTFLPFFILPLILHPDWLRKKTLQKVLMHSLVLFIMIAFYSFIRFIVFKENRMLLDYSLHSDKMQIIANYIAMQIAGPLMSLALMMIRPLWGFIFSGIVGFFILLISFFLILFTIKKIGGLYSFKSTMDGEKIQIETLLFTATFKKDYLKWIQLIIIGVVCVMISYLFIVNKFRPMPFGRSTSVHIAGSFGWCLIVPSLVILILKLSNRKNLIFIITAMYFSGLIGFHFSIQNDFKKVWKIKRGFWNDMLKYDPEVKENSWIYIIDLPPEQYQYTLNPRRNHYIKPFAFDMTILLTEIFEFPKTWSNKPSVCIFPSSDQLKFTSNKLTWLPSIYGKETFWQELDTSNILLFRYYKDSVIPCKEFTMKIEDSLVVFKSANIQTGINISKFKHKPFITELKK
jgi:hypothetical protein